MRKETGQVKKRTKEMSRITVAVILFILSGCLMVYASKNADGAQWYSTHIYPVLIRVIGGIAGLVPFSLAEIGLYVLLLVFIASFAVTVRREISEGKPKGKFFFRWFTKVMFGAAVLVFVYVICCGVNYHRNSFSQEEGIVTHAYSSDELKAICIRLTEEVNVRVGMVERDDNGVMELSAPEQDGAVEAMEHLSQSFSSLKGYYPRPKKLIVSEILSYQGLTGIYSPFTAEANYNGDMTAYNIPFTACHELSHLRGFMQEQEANFIAFLACINSEREDFQYSGYLSGWVYCMNALYRADYEAWQEVRNMLDSLAEPDLAANSAFWDQYEGTISETAEKINDTYLKANGQADGVQSYDRMVDLIVAYLD